MEEFPTRDQYDAIRDASHELDWMAEREEQWREIIQTLGRGYEDFTIQEWDDLIKRIEDDLGQTFQDNGEKASEPWVAYPLEFNEDLFETLMNDAHVAAEFWEEQIEKWNSLLSDLPEYEELSPSEWNDFLPRADINDVFGFRDYVEQVLDVM